MWLDATRKAELSFVSHAHADHIARHERVIATQPTLRLMEHRLGPLNVCLPAPYNRPFEVGPLSLELLPAGHILGSAQLRVTRRDGVRVVYTGDLNLSAALTAEPAQIAECDVLVMEATFGHPRYRFPPKREVLAQVADWAHGCIRRDVAPVVLGYALGKAQEAIRYLGEAGFRIAAHRSVSRISAIYEECGVPLGPVRTYDGHWEKGEVLVFPPFRRRAGLATLGPRETAVLTGWAMDPRAASRYGADRAFPLSDHADFNGLMAYARDTGAQEVLLHHGFAETLAKAMCAKGIDARPLGTVKQLELFDLPLAA